VTTKHLPRRCTASAVGLHRLESFTSADKSYDVHIDTDGKNTCTCVAFVMKRNKLGGLTAIGTPDCTCKHIEAVLWTKGCGWDSDTGEEPQFEAVCPRCYNDTETYDPRDPNTIDLDELMADYLALSRKLER
jgi:hypothetical protein